MTFSDPTTPINSTPYQKTWKQQQDDKKPKKGGPNKRKMWRNRLLILFLIIFLAGAIGVIGLFAWYSRDLPDPDKLLDRNLAQSTRIYDRTGETLLYEIHGDVKRTIVQLEDIPDYLKWATISIEDKHFYEHSGFDITGFIRAVVINIVSVGQSRPGGSTITQQLVKNAILTNEKKITRKIKELVLSYQIEKKFTKDQILKLYFNEIPYGSVSYGVESAAQIYFGKSVRDVNLAEAAILAALPQSPTYYSPYGSHTDILFGRQQYILDLMVEEGYITQEEADEAKNTEITFESPKESIVAPHFVFYVKEQLTEKYGEKMVEQGGLKVITSLDTYKQEAAETAVTEGIEKVKSYGGSNASLVAVDPKTGDIVAMVGSVDYFDTANDGNVNVAIRNRQPGSSFKPVAYATAFDKGYTPETMVFDVQTNFGGNPAYMPNNYDGVEHGPVSMRQALAGSLNIPAVKTLYLAGVDATIETARSMGYTTIDDPDRYGLSLVLGGAEVRLLEHVGAYSVFAREGLRHPLNAILRVEDKDGKVLEEFEPEENRVMDEEVARKINNVLSDDGARSYVFGRGSNLTLSDRPVAAKTGTTNDYRDAWTIGYTPSLVAGVWVGNNDNTQMKGGAAGSVVAAPIWHNFMESLLVGTPVETFKAPKTDIVDKMMLNGQIDNVFHVKVDSLTQRAIPDACLDTYPEEFLVDKTFKEAHTILYYVQKNSPRDDAPASPSADPQYQSWEDAVQLWASGQPNYITPSNPLKYESCELRDDDNSSSSKSASLTAPDDNEVITTSPLEIRAKISSGFDLDRIEIYLDDDLIQTITEKPYSYDYDLSNTDNGFYTVKVLFYETDGSVIQQSKNINVLLTQESSSYYLTQPSEQITLEEADFPYTIKGIAYHPDGAESASVYYQNGSSKLIKKTTDFDLNQFEVTWTSAPDTGTYELYFTFDTESGQTIESDPIEITISD